MSRITELSTLSEWPSVSMTISAMSSPLSAVSSRFFAIER